MGQAMSARPPGLGTDNARSALLGGGALLVVVIAGALVLMGVTGAEVAATVLFVPVFAVGLLAGRARGYGAAAVATLMYLALRGSDLADAGVASAGVMLLARACAYAVAGHVGALTRGDSGDGAPVDASTAARDPRSDRRTAPSRAPVADDRTRLEPVDPWDGPLERTERVPVMAGAAGGSASFADDGAEYRGDTMAMSGGWPPEPEREHSHETASGPWPHRDPSGGGGPPLASDHREPPFRQPWERHRGGDAAEDDWDAVQESWRRQNGLPPHDPYAPSYDEPPFDDWSAPRGDAPPATNGGVATDAWGTPLDGGAPGAPADPWAAPPAHGRGPETDPWGTPLPGNGAGERADPWTSAAAGGAWPAADPATRPPGPAPPGEMPGPGPGPAPSRLPAVDAETGLWTAQFLRDRLADERARSRRSGTPCSLVLVQVPDAPLAQLPYRRQVTLLRELGYQFVAGGVVDHMVHVPDEQQHWFAVILPDTDRSGAQVLERRLRLGIRGYLASRGLPLRELDSASLTSPDDDAALGQIWDALIGPDGDR